MRKEPLRLPFSYDDEERQDRAEYIPDSLLDCVNRGSYFDISDRSAAVLYDILADLIEGYR